MRKSDLKTGMLVELRDGDKAWILKDTADGDWLQWNDSRCLNLRDYNENLNHLDRGYLSEKYDIVKIYQPVSYQYLGSESVDRFKLIYDRSKSETKVNIKAKLEGVDEIKQLIDELENRLKNMKINLNL